MSFIEEIFKFFSDNEPDDVSDDRIRIELNKRFDLEIKSYLNYYDSFKGHLNDKYYYQIRKLIIIRIFARDIWDVIFNNYDLIHYKDRKYRISALGKILNRILLTTDENITLFRNGMGISILSNSRMMLESYAIAVYINTKGEIEADRFQDYAKVQRNQFLKNKSNKLFGNKYNHDFYKSYGWITDKKLRTISKLVRNLDDSNYIEYYSFLSNYVHASPYSIESTMLLGNPERKMEEHHFPLSYTETLNINIKIISDFIVLIINCFLSEDKVMYQMALNAVLKWC